MQKIEPQQLRNLQPTLPPSHRRSTSHRLRPLEAHRPPGERRLPRRGALPRRLAQLGGATWGSLTLFGWKVLVDLVGVGLVCLVGWLVGWLVLVGDGWFDASGSHLNAFSPAPDSLWAPTHPSACHNPGVSGPKHTW